VLLDRRRDLAGTGRVKIKHTQTFQDGGPLAAWHIA
jgi:hypothetical protein